MTDGADCTVDIIRMLHVMHAIAFVVICALITYIVGEVVYVFGFNVLFLQF